MKIFLQKQRNPATLSKAKTLNGYKLRGVDGEIGKIKEFYFDDRHWTIRYLVADTGTWLSSRQVLISPYALIDVNKGGRYIAVDLTKKQIEDSPSLDSDKPVSRQFEDSYYDYYGWPAYWSGTYAWGYYPNITLDRAMHRKSTQPQGGWNPYLRSTHDVRGHHIEAADGAIGHVDDFIIDDLTWAIRYLVVDTHNWWPGKQVLISPEWIGRVSWEESKVFVNLSRDAVKRSPEYTDKSLLTRGYEIGLHQHYKRRGYWIDKVSAEKKMPELGVRNRMERY